MPCAFTGAKRKRWVAQRARPAGRIENVHGQIAAAIPVIRHALQSDGKRVGKGINSTIGGAAVVLNDHGNRGGTEGIRRRRKRQ